LNRFEQPVIARHGDPDEGVIVVEQQVKRQLFVVFRRVDFYRLAEKIVATGIQQERRGEYKKEVFHVVELLKVDEVDEVDKVDIHPLEK